MSKSVRAAVIVAMASVIALPAGVAAAAENGEIGTAVNHGEIGTAVSRSPQPYGTLAICAGRGDAPASTIQLIRSGHVVKTFKLSGCKLLSAKNGLSAGRYKVRHTAPEGQKTSGWIAGGLSGSGDQHASSIRRSNPSGKTHRSMSTAGFLSADSSNWVTFTRTAR